MDARRLFDRICQRHGLESNRLTEYVPLLERAIASPEKVRDRLLKMVEESVSRRALGDPTATFLALERDLDDEVLLAVSKSLHGWAPPWKNRSSSPGGANAAGGKAAGGNTGSGDSGDGDAGGSLPEGLGGLL